MKPVKPGHRREEVLNTLLVSELNSLGGLFFAEERNRGGAPDGNGSWYGMSVVIECKYDVDKTARDELESQIKQRLDSGIAAVGIEVLYPSELRLSSKDPANDLRSTVFSVRLRTREGDLTDWMSVSGVSGIAEKLDLARSFLVGGDAVARSVEQLSEVVERLAKAIGRQPGHELEIVRLVTAADPVGLSTASANIRETARKVSGLVIATALLMQHSLTDFDHHVPKPPSNGDLRIKLVASWRTVIDHDYRAVFLTALQILETLGDSELSLNQELKHAVEVTRQIVQRRVLGRHDLVGRIYHTLLTAQKYLATYYTKIPAAVILAGIALHPSRWEEGKFSLEREFSFRFCDPAQGTGTLLSAALTEIRKYLIRENTGLHRDVDLRAISKKLIEEDIYGFDVLAYAVQVAAATLLLSSPGTTVDKSKLFQLSFGGTQGKLGSLEFLFGDGNETQGILFGALGSTVGIDTVFPDRKQKGKADVTGEISLQDVPLPQDLDLVIMNPPFTRSGGSSRLLGSLDAEEHSVGRERLGKLSSRLEGASVSAGLGAMFVPLAHKMLRDNGRMAVILPKTMLTGSQWQPTRDFLARNYHIEFVISSHDPSGWSFSDSTSLSECMFIARKRLPGEDLRSKETIWVMLEKNPMNSLDASAVVDFVTSASVSQKVSTINLSGTLGGDLGSTFKRPTPTDGSPWRHAQFSSGELDKVADCLVEGRGFNLPRSGGKLVELPIISLGSCGTTGPDRRDLMDGFELSSRVTAFPAVQGNDSERVKTLIQEPNQFLRPRTVPLKNRKLKDTNALWAASGRLLVAERLRLNSSRCVAIYSSEDVLSNVFHCVRLNENETANYMIQTVWLNSTLGVLAWTYLASDTEGAWVSVKKFQLRQMPLLDYSRLKTQQKDMLVRAFASIKEQEIQPVSKIERDPVRQFCDETIAEVFGLPVSGLKTLRDLLGTEPKMTDGDIGLPDSRDREFLDRAVNMFRLRESA